MEIYTYGIIDSNAKIDNFITGLTGAQIYNIPYCDIGIVASKFDRQIQAVTKDLVLEHEEIVERLMENFTVLPMRFFTVFNKKEDVLSMLQDYYTDFKQNLDKLHNKVEFGVKAIWPGDAIRGRITDACSKVNVSITKSAPGRNFIMKKLEKYKIDKEFEKEADKHIAVIDNVFSQYAVEKKLRKLNSNILFLRAYYLVTKDRQDDFKKAFEQFRTTHNDVKYLFSGPWPPYNFIHLTKKSNLLQNFCLIDYFNIKF
jgi:glycosyltransferase involved in cell wall biosynthesis